MAHILVVEGSHEGLVAKTQSGDFNGPAENYAAHLSALHPDLTFDIIRPAFSDAPQLDINTSLYDGYVFPGSGVAWSAAQPEAKSARDAMEIALGTGKPVLGSCYGLHLGAVVLGGRVEANPKGTELAIARDIHLTSDGRDHALFENKPARFDALCMHRDDCTKLPAGAVLLASNAHCAVQAFGVETGGVQFWGVQYHPELEFSHIAGFIRRSDVDGFHQVAAFGAENQIEGLSSDQMQADFDQLQHKPDDQELGAKYHLGADLTDRTIHEAELINWVKLL